MDTKVKFVINGSRIEYDFTTNTWSSPDSTLEAEGWLSIFPIAYRITRVTQRRTEELAYDPAPIATILRKLAETYNATIDDSALIQFMQQTFRSDVLY
jgi:hypothetical protein